MFQMGDPATAQRLQALNQLLQQSQSPGQAAGIQQQMNAAQLQGAQNMMAKAQGSPGPGMDPLTGYNAGTGAQQMAAQNLAAMQQAFGRNQLGIQQAANAAYPMTALGVAGRYPGAGGAQQASSSTLSDMIRGLSQQGS